MGTTGEAARQQLLKLAAEGVVEATTAPKGVGRPAQTWRLATMAIACFPDAHANLTADLIRTIRTTLGQPALDLLITAREAETRKCYERKLQGLTSIEDRIARLAEIRSEEGYMAEWQRTDDGRGWLLLENHCPICVAAAACQEFCRAELNVFRDVLGSDVTVQREEHILVGARRCAYRIQRAQNERADGSGGIQRNDRRSQACKWAGGAKRMRTLSFVPSSSEAM
ncbi:helix-turn-helix transcriptional regulator [Vineibacter terrae]|uniref:helix-turn-helix transcriptional regulator n=1 Tax=Vineibacter terrae TaxID=2586908 RepID=UPI001C49B7D3